MELGGAGQAGQHPLALEPPRPRPEAAWPRSGGRFPHRAGPGGRAEDRPRRGRSGSCSPTSACRPPATGCGTSSASSWRRTRSATWSCRRSSSWCARRPEAAYEEKEIELPGDGRAVPLHHPRRQRTQALRARGVGRLGRRSGSSVELSIEDLKNKQRDEIRALLVEHSRRFADGPGGGAGRGPGLAGPHLRAGRCPADQALRAAYDDGRLQELSDWLAEEVQLPLAARGDAPLQRRAPRNAI